MMLWLLRVVLGAMPVTMALMVPLLLLLLLMVVVVMIGIVG